MINEAELAKWRDEYARWGNCQMCDGPERGLRLIEELEKTKSLLRSCVAWLETRPVIAFTSTLRNNIAEQLGDAK